MPTVAETCDMQTVVTAAPRLRLVPVPEPYPLPRTFFRHTLWNRGLAIVQVVLALTLIPLDRVGFYFNLESIDFMTSVGSGIFTGIFFLITGLIGLCAPRQIRTKNLHGCHHYKWILAGSVIGMILTANDDMDSIVVLHTWPAAIAKQKAVLNLGPFLALRIMSMVLFVVLFLVSVATLAIGVPNGCRDCRRRGGNEVTDPTAVLVVRRASFPAASVTAESGDGSGLFSGCFS